MAYNHYQEKEKWKEWKRKEEEKLRKYKFNEDKIQELREYDKDVFKKERNYQIHENTTSDQFFKTKPFNSSKQINNIEDLLDEIENEALLEMLKKQDKDTLKILVLKTQGYRVKEISDVLGININTVYYKIKKIKNFINSLK